VQSPKQEAEMRLQVFDGVMGDYLMERLRFPITAQGPDAKPRKGVVQASTDDVEVHAAADGRSAVLARAAAGSKMKSEAEVGGYFRVRVGELVGYVASADVARSSGRVVLGAEGLPKGMSPVFGRDPPRIGFDSLPASGALRTSEKTIDLKVLLQDDGPVRDVYIFNGDQKVFYETLEKSRRTETEVKTTLKLKPGVNLITVVAREDDEFAQREGLTIFSTSGDPFAKKKAAAH
jgi:hypothetical protein